MSKLPSHFGETPIFGSLDEELEFFISLCRSMFDEDRSTNLTAFEALLFIACREWKRELENGVELDPDDQVSVPWWAVQALAIGYGEYKEDYEGGKKPKLGQVLGIDSVGKGKRPKTAAHLKTLRDHRISYQLADQILTGKSVTTAIKDFAKTYSMTTDNLLKIWYEHGERATSVLKNAKPNIETED